MRVRVAPQPHPRGIIARLSPLRSRRKGQPSRIAETICGAVEIRKASVRFFIVMEQVQTPQKPTHAQTHARARTEEGKVRNRNHTG